MENTPQTNNSGLPDGSPNDTVERLQAVFNKTRLARHQLDINGHQLWTEEAVRAVRLLWQVSILCKDIIIWGATPERTSLLGSLEAVIASLISQQQRN